MRRRWTGTPGATTTVARSSTTCATSTPWATRCATSSASPQDSNPSRRGDSPIGGGSTSHGAASPHGRRTAGVERRWGVASSGVEPLAARDPASAESPPGASGVAGGLGRGRLWPAPAGTVTFHGRTSAAIGLTESGELTLTGRGWPATVPTLNVKGAQHRLRRQPQAAAFDPEPSSARLLAGAGRHSLPRQTATSARDLASALSMVLSMKRPSFSDQSDRSDSGSVASGACRQRCWYEASNYPIRWEIHLGAAQFYAAGLGTCRRTRNPPQ
jgi:hypothetical protein